MALIVFAICSPAHEEDKKAGEGCPGLELLRKRVRDLTSFPLRTGHMLFEGQDYLSAAPWISIAPGVAILLSVLGFNLLGEGLRDALDPKEE